MALNTAGKLEVTDLDFDTIKTNLKTYLKGQAEFTDYDFEGGGLNILLDVLAYNTHYNAFMANMAANEMFLDTAVKRNSVVSHAKALGYTPVSVTAPAAYINVTVNDATGGSLTMSAGHVFTTNVSGKSYQFVNITARTIQPSDGAQIKALANGYAADTEVGTGYNGGGGQDEPFGGLIHLESKALGASGGRIVLKVPHGDPFAGMAFGSDFAGNQQLPGGAIVHEGGSTVDITDSPKSRNTLQARVNFAFKAADSVTAALPGAYSNAEGDIGTWGALTDATHVNWMQMTGPSVGMDDLGKPQTNPFAGSTGLAINENAEKVRDLHNEEVE